MDFDLIIIILLDIAAGKGYSQDQVGEICYFCNTSAYCKLSAEIS